MYLLYPSVGAFSTQLDTVASEGALRDLEAYKPGLHLVEGEVTVKTTPLALIHFTRLSWPLRFGLPILV